MRLYPSHSLVGFGLDQAVCVTPTPTPTPTPITAQQFLTRLEQSPEELTTIETYEQKSEEWLDARKGRLTASNFGAAVGHNKYQSPRGLVSQMLWHTFKGNKFTQWGADHEATAFDMYRNFMLLEMSDQQQIQKNAWETFDSLSETQQAEWVESLLYPSGIPTAFDVSETGLVIRAPRYWMGNSPDGLVHVTYDDGVQETGLLEIKCPASKKLYTHVSTPNNIPRYYMDQIQGTMGNLQLPWCDFVVWTPSQMSVTRVPFSATYWNTVLLPSLTTFYFDLYLPAAVKKENNQLQEGEIE
jgi:hypothetical protein